MGGSGGSDYDIDYISGHGGAAGPSCATLVFDAYVASPDPAVAAAVGIGDTCDVLIDGAPPQVRLYVRTSSALLGALTEHWADLTRCIANGYAYEAIVIAVTPAVRVRVQLLSAP